MRATERNKILTSYYGSKERYEKVAEWILRLFDADIDPSVPADSIYTIKYRLKAQDRLLEKIDQENQNPRRRIQVNVTNYQNKIYDVLGIRIVCLRLSDVEKVQLYLGSLKNEDKLVFVKGPTTKKTFVLPVNPGEGIPKDIDLQYSGYSSVHYVAKLGRTLRLPKEYGTLLAELQVRTILEEAWGEIDHKYRYEIVRKGTNVPEYITRGFYSFSAYLQAAALHAEQLCGHLEELKPQKRRLRPRKGGEKTISLPTAAGVVEPPKHGVAARKSLSLIPVPPKIGLRLPILSEPTAGPDPVEEMVHEKFGFFPTERLTAYVKSRMTEHGFSTNNAERAQVLDKYLLAKEVLSRFKEIYMDVVGKEPFKDQGRDIDVINVLNFGLMKHGQSEAVAREGLIPVLKKRYRLSPM